MRNLVIAVVAALVVAAAACSSFQSEFNDYCQNAPPSALTASCAADSECCPGQACEEGGCCGKDTARCDGPGQCCAGLLCRGGACVRGAPAGDGCDAGSDCTSGACVQGICCNTACSGTCQSCTAPGQVGTCVVLAQGTASSCTPFVCDGVSNNCPTTCTSTLDCAPAFFCQSGACVPKNGNGARCTAADQCTSSNCVDGFCCDTACQNGGATRCETCARDGGEGACTSTCPSAGLFCSPTGCAAKQTLGAACVNANECVSGFCANGRCCDRACNGGCERCSDAGTCTPLPAGTDAGSACVGFYCRGGADGGQCPNRCLAFGGDSACWNSHHCNSDSCVLKSVIGSTCLGNNACQSGNCVDNRCCNEDAGTCKGCRACNVTGFAGTCRNVPAGTDPNNVCTYGAASCSTDVCDGTGSCRAFDAGTTCSGSTCAPGRLCCDTGCNGQCNGTTVDGTACSGTLQSCPGVPSSGSCPNGYTCANAYACRTSCSSNADCLSSHYCFGGSCVAKKPNGSACFAQGGDYACLSNVCAPTSNCTECYQNDECSPATGYCLNFACAPCQTGGNCVQAGLGNTCNTSGQCTCSFSSECTNPRAPRCATNSECTCGGGSGSICRNGQRCTDATVNGSCKWETGWPCQQSSECFSGVCSTTTRTCS